MELLQGAVVGHYRIAVCRAEGDPGTRGHTGVVDPDDDIYQTLPAARLDLLDAPHAAGDLGVAERLANEQTGVEPADFVAHPVPEVPVGVPAAVRLPY